MMIKKALILLILPVLCILGQDELSSLDRMKILKMFPPTEEEDLQVREIDQVFTNDGDIFRCAVVGVETSGVMIRQEGLKIQIPMKDIKRVLLARSLYDVFNTRFNKIGKMDFASQHKLAVEAFEHIGEDQRFYDWCLEKLKTCAKTGGYVPSYIKVGDIFSAENNYAVAELYYGKAAELDDDNYEAFSKYAVNLKRQNKYYDAEKWFRKSIALNDSDAAILEGLAYSLLKLGKIRDAESYYLKSLEINPESGSAMAGYALILAYTDRFSKAREYLRNVFDKGIFTFEAYAALGMIEYRFGKYPEAQKAFTNALAVSETSDEPEVYAFLSVINTQAGRLTENEAIFENLQKEEILTQPEVANAYGYFLLKKGDGLHNSGEKEKARELYAKAGDVFLKGLSALEENFYGLYGIALSHLRRGNERDYIKYFNKAYDSNPDWLYSKLMLAYSLLENNSFSEALAEFNMMFKNNLDMLKADYSRTAGGEGSLTEEDREDLRAVKKKARETLELLYLGKVRTQIQLGRFPEAHATAAEFAAIMPKSQRIYDYLGFLSFTLGKMDEAKDYFKTGKDLGSLYSRKKYAELLVAQNQIEYLDDFDRDDNTTLRNNWDEEETTGVEISIKDQKVQMKGTVSRDWDRTAFSKSYRASTFISMSVDVQFYEEYSGFYSGIFLAGRGSEKGIFLIRNNSGQICYASSDLQSDAGEWKWTPSGKWPEGESASLSIVQTDQQSRKFELRVNDVTVLEISAGSLVNEDYFKVGCFIQGEKGAEVLVSFNDFRVISQKIE